MPKSNTPTKSTPNKDPFASSDKVVGATKKRKRTAGPFDSYIKKIIAQISAKRNSDVKISASEKAITVLDGLVTKFIVDVATAAGTYTRERKSNTVNEKQIIYGIQNVLPVNNITSNGSLALPGLGLTDALEAKAGNVETSKFVDTITNAAVDALEKYTTQKEAKKSN